MSYVFILIDTPYPSKIMRYIKLSPNSFVRIFEDGKHGYIINQSTRMDRLYNEIGADFLRELSKKPQTIEQIVQRLIEQYQDVSLQTLLSDYNAFVDELVKNHFIIDGCDYDEVESMNDDFTYEVDTPKTSMYSFSQSTTDNDTTSTQLEMNKLNMGKPTLWSIQVEITGKCNERCIHCYIPNSYKDDGIHMPFSSFRKLIDEFSEMGGLYVTLTGGEALMHKDFAKMLRYCREKDLQITVLSNLISLTDDIVNVMKETRVNMVNVSLYSVTPSVHDSITKVAGSCEKTKNAIEKLRTNDVPVQISCPILIENKECYFDVIEYARSLKTKASIDYNIVAQKNEDTSNLTHRVSLVDIEKLIRRTVENNPQYTRFLEETPLDVTKTDLEAYPCGAALSILNIGSTGDVTPCATWNLSLGNVFKTSLKEVWEKSAVIKKIRKTTFASFPKCLKCEASEYCTICMAKNYSESNDYLSPNEYFCEVAHINKKVVDEWRKTNLQSH